MSWYPDGVDAALAAFPQWFQDFVTKQVSKFCGTNRQLSRIDKKIINVCPSCGKNDESARHITRCSDKGRQSMLRYSVDDLARWMRSTKADPHLCHMTSKYLMAQSSKNMISCMWSTSPLLHTLATVQDCLGWDNFVEGRISMVFLEVIKVDPDRAKSKMTPER